MSGNDVATYCLRLGDDALVLAQRLCEWAARSPQLEEDVALMNLALDLLGQSRSLLTLAGEREGAGRDEDDLAFLRDETDFVNAQLMELDNGDFGRTMARQLVVSAYAVPLWQALSSSTDADLAAVAAKAVKEVAYHLDHAASWVVRLGDGTEESHRRMQAGLDEVWPYVHELFEVDPLLERLIQNGVAADPAALQPVWQSTVERVLTESTLVVPETSWRPTGGRTGTHTEAFGYLLAELQHLHRSHPGRHVVTAEQVREVLATVPDPELPVVSIEELGILRDVEVDGDRVVVTITPTYSGCPAMDEIEADVRRVLSEHGWSAEVRTTLSPAWTTDWMSDDARRKLREYGIAPPGELLLQIRPRVECPQCGSGDTEELTRFGSTSCQSMWRCRSCREPFSHFKAH